jgi:hypothetical protein
MQYLVATGLAAALTGALIWAVTSNQCDRFHQEARMRVAALAATIASGIPADGITMVGQPGAEKTPAAVMLRSSLIDARQANPEVRRIYALVPGRNPGTWRFAIDAVASRTDPVRSGDSFDIGSRIQIEEARTGPTADLAPVPDRRGLVNRGEAS